MADKLAWFPWFANDWLSDEKLQSCSFGAKGLWADLLSLMHKCDRRGYLQQANGRPPTASQLARLVRAHDPGEVAHLMQELIDSGVPSVTDDGILFSRKMVHDEQIRQARSKAGRKGGRTTGDLLKQNAKQKSSKHSSKPLVSGLSEEAGEKVGGSGGEKEEGETPRPDFAPTAASLASEFFFHGGRTSGGVRNDEFEARMDFDELLRIGFKADFLLKQIQDEGKTRDRTEYLWQFKARINNGKHQTQPGGNLGSSSRVGSSERSREAARAKTKCIGETADPQNTGAKETGA